MLTVKYAVLITKGKQVRVEHIFHQRQDAASWIEVYSLLGVNATIEELQPALGLVRGQDVWLAYQPGELRTYATREQAEAEVARGRGLAVLETPIWPAMPVQRGAPQVSTTP